MEAVEAMARVGGSQMNMHAAEAFVTVPAAHSLLSARAQS